MSLEPTPATPAAFVWKLRVRFSDTDASGRIHYTAMFRYFEAAEQEFLRAAGFPYAQVEHGGIGFPRVHTEADFTGEVRNDDLLAIEVRVERVGGTSFTLGYTAKVDERVVARGNIVVVAMDKQTRKSRPLPEDMAAALTRAVAPLRR